MVGTLPPSLAVGMLTVGPKALPDADVKGHLFDVDGTLIDTMPLFFESWIDVCSGFGLSITEQQFYGFAGLPLPEIVRLLHQAAKGCDPPDGFIDRLLAAKKAAHDANEVRLGHPPPIGCVARLARESVAAGLPVCVATSGLRDHVEAHLVRTPIQACGFPFVPTTASIPLARRPPRASPTYSLASSS